MAALPAAQPRVAPDEDDDVSSDTTVEEVYDEGMLWTVEDVLAEVAAESGERHFLVRWTGYDLYDATWEPEIHLEPATIKSWEDNKEAVERGEKERFNVADWWSRRISHLGARLDKAKRRNAKRQRRGRPVTGTAAELEGTLRETILDEAGFYGIEPSEFPLDDSDSDVNERVLPPAKVIDLTASPPHEQKAPRPRTNRPSQPRRSTSARQDTTSPGKKNRKDAGLKGPSTAGASTATGQRPRQPPQQTPGARKGVPPSKTSSTTPGVPQPSRQAQPTAPRQNVLKAKRTGAAANGQGAGANIFTSGKVARKRRNLSDLMKDPTRQHKLFQKHRIARIAYKRSRDKEDLPPPTVSAKLFDISTGPANHRPKETEGARQTTADLPETPSILAFRRTTDDASNGAEEAPRPSAEKKRKSVTFSDTLAMRSPSPLPDSSPVSAPMDIDEPDDGLFVPRRPPSPVKVKPEGSDRIPYLRRVSTGDNVPFSQTLTIKRVVDFGPGGARKIEVSLDGIPKTSGEPWFTDLMKSKEISFTHTCVAKNLAFQLENIASAKLGAGNIRSDSSSEALENVAARLRLGSFGAVCFRDGYIIVVYPSRCNDWKADGFAAGATSPSEVDLSYMLFARGFDENPPPDQVQPLEPPADGTPLGDRALVWQQILGFDYRRLLPKDLVKEGEPTKKRHAFFLVFPPSREAELDALCLYLRSCDRECLIYTNREGAWEYILKNPGLYTIIIHEATSWALRRLTNVHNLIPASDSRVTFWRATTAMTAHSDVPLGESERWTPPGKIGLHRMLPSGKAILVTPSFLLTQPCRAAQFLIWYSERIAQSRHTRTNKIVVARGVCDYVREVADQRWMRHKSAGASVGERTGEACGVLREDCEATEAAWMTLRELFESSRSGGCGRDPLLAPIVCAPDELAPCDEQSLVNWFGWWSLMNLDAYRCFIVLGTDEADMGDGTAATFTTRLPTYNPDMISDPEGGVHDVTSQVAANCGESKFICRRLPNDHPNSITSFLEGLNERYMYNAPYKTLAMIYKFPVGFSCDESRRVSPDSHPRLRSFPSWFGFLRPYTRWLSVGEFKPPIAGAVKFVYGGLFYTPLDESDGSHSVRHEGQNPRHPWLAFYRPARPHLLSKKKHDGMYELIIWDWTTPSKYPPSKFDGGDTVTDDKLSMAQRQLIDLISKKTGEKNAGSVLENVWLGGPKSATLDAHPMDVTLGFLEEIMEDTRFAIPATEMQLRDANYRKVVPQSQAQPLAPESPVMAARDDDVVHSDIFHPPRGNGTVQPSRYKNVLFEQAQEVQRSRGVSKDGTFSFRFEPTTKWYEQQRKEGRAFEHVLVGRWKVGFDVLLIGKEGKNGGSTGGAGSPSGLS